MRTGTEAHRRKARRYSPCGRCAVRAFSSAPAGQHLVTPAHRSLSLDLVRPRWTNQLGHVGAGLPGPDGESGRTHYPTTVSRAARRGTAARWKLQIPATTFRVPPSILRVPPGVPLGRERNSERGNSEAILTASPAWSSSPAWLAWTHRPEASRPGSVVESGRAYRTHEGTRTRTERSVTWQRTLVGRLGRRVPLQRSVQASAFRVSGGAAVWSAQSAPTATAASVLPVILGCAAPLSTHVGCMCAFWRSMELSIAYLWPLARYTFPFTSKTLRTHAIRRSNEALEGGSASAAVCALRIRCVAQTSCSMALD